MSLSAFSVWTQEHLRGAQRLAQQDEADRERLDRLIRRGAGNIGDDGSVIEVFCVECGDPVRKNAVTEVCDRCRNRIWMREERIRLESGFYKPGMTKEQRRAARRMQARHSAAAAAAARGDEHRLRTIQGMARRQEAP